MKGLIARSYTPRERGGLKYTGLRINNHYSYSWDRNRYDGFHGSWVLRGIIVAPIVEGIFLLRLCCGAQILRRDERTPLRAWCGIITFIYTAKVSNATEFYVLSLQCHNALQCHKIL